MTTVYVFIEHTLSKEEALKRKADFSNRLGLNLGFKQTTIVWDKRDPRMGSFRYQVEKIICDGSIHIDDAKRAVTLEVECPPIHVDHALLKEVLERIAQQSFAPQLLPMTRLE